MNEFRIIIIVETIWQNVIFRRLVCVWMKLFEADGSRFR